MDLQIFTFSSSVMKTLYHLPQWFIHGHSAKLARFSTLENFPNYMQNVEEEHPYSILNELQKDITKKSFFIFCRANTLCPTIVLYA